MHKITADVSSAGHRQAVMWSGQLKSHLIQGWELLPRPRVYNATHRGSMAVRRLIQCQMLGPEMKECVVTAKARGVWTHTEGSWSHDEVRMKSDRWGGERLDWERRTGPIVWMGENWGLHVSDNSTTLTRQPPKVHTKNPWHCSRWNALRIILLLVRLDWYA